jgi:hypothetical protein
MAKETADRLIILADGKVIGIRNPEATQDDSHAILASMPIPTLENVSVDFQKICETLTMLVGVAGFQAWIQESPLTQGEVAQKIVAWRNETNDYRSTLNH